MSHFDPSAMLSFDLETTSANPLDARIVTSALVTIKGREVTPEELLADPGVEIPEEAAAIHGITTDYARQHGKDHDEVLKYTVDAIRAAWDEGLTLVVFNAAYDLTVLRKLTGDFVVTGPVFDPLVVDRQLDRFRKGPRNLTAMCQHYNVRLDNAHEATSDALAAARIAWRLSQLYPEELVRTDVDELMVNQAVWHKDHAEKLAQYFASKGRPTDGIDTGWPLHSRV
ncbi:3'-5' exonuclease [Corynebacterium mendelii]|uniref:3'-5' exonuclease n=1 Tax=Corynebacterium mendelii TaxID=2765362 RepID=A0A939IUI6_9CORY|nr:3'-5' exonuclease [Corynebacterium mendelii]MBN9644974.1 3'-5' exonuclease [Corynebacterium mendelii]